jgi:senataxin
VHERVPSRFRDEDHYIDIFEPLLLEEFRAQLERGRQEETDMPVSMKVVEMSDADDFRSIMFGTKNHPFGPSDLVLLYRPAVRYNNT